MNAPQRPLELILARNLLSSIATPAFLVGEQGTLLFYNDGAAAMLGRRFEDAGMMTAQEWTTAFGPFDADEAPMDYDEIPATIAIRSRRPFHGVFRIRTAAGNHQDVAASAIPLVGTEGSRGAIVIFWPLTGVDDTESVDDGREDEGENG
jgi:PAS domain-containing protein